MGLLIACARGCGETIEVTDEMLDEAREHNSPINVAHEVCPTEPSALERLFHVQFTVVEHMPDGKEEPILSVGEQVEATSFKRALPMLQAALERQWGQVLSMADIVDQPLSDPTADPDQTVGGDV